MKLLSELSSIELEPSISSFTAPFENDEIWKLTILKHLKVLKYLNSKDFYNSTIEQIGVINNFLRIFSNSSQLPILYVIGDDCWKLAKLSDSSDIKEQSARTINKLFIACITERSNLNLKSRKWGTYRSASLLLRIYFNLGQLNLVQNLLKALNSCELPEIDDFPRSHTVTFNYFLGRYHFEREEFQLSENCFIFCFERLRDAGCKGYYHNTFSVDVDTNEKDSNIISSSQLNSVLHFLIAIKLISNLKKPKIELISLFKSENNRIFYNNLFKIISSGDFKKFKEEILKQNYHQLLRIGSLGVYEKLFLLILRQKIIRIYNLTEKSTRISLILLNNLCNFGIKDGNSDTSSYESSQLPNSLDDLTCLVANLISRGLIRGYISEEKNFLVLSSQNPFPTNLSFALCDQ